MYFRRSQRESEIVLYEPITIILDNIFGKHRKKGRKPRKRDRNANQKRFGNELHLVIGVDPPGNALRINV